MPQANTASQADDATVPGGFNARTAQANAGRIPTLPVSTAVPPVSVTTAPARGKKEDPDKTQELPAPNSVRILHLLATIEAHDGFKEAATAFATELAQMVDCDRVSVGLLGRRHVKVEALSHSTEFRANQALLREIGAAMEEAIWQGATLIFPLPEGAQPRVDRAHASLAQRHGSLGICTVLLLKSGKPIGAIMLERNSTSPYGRSDVTFIENIGALLGPLLQVRREAGLPWPGKLWVALKQAFAPLFGPGHRFAKIAAASVVLLIAAAALIPAQYRVSAPARLEGAVQRVMVASADGYLKQAHVRPGDRVTAGQLLAELADEDLKLEQRKAQSEVAQLEGSYGEALAKQDRTQVAVLIAKLAQARAQLSLVEQQLERVRLVAPFDGVVISGDLTQSLGAPVKRGEVLMKVAPEHDFRVIIEVDERDIGHVKLGQPGYLALAALPGESLPFDVKQITPVATTGDGRNYFEMEANLKSNSPQLRPGLEGVAKVEAGQRSWLWIITHRLYDWVRLTLWSWLG
jgi:multidrug efflux pump subunit AcrA (membrane-fusion protein)